MYTDPSGEIFWLIPVAIGLVAGGYIGGAVAAGDGGFANADWNAFDGSWKGTDWWKGAIIGGIAGAGLGAYAAFALPGTTFGAGWGWTSQTLMSANMNMFYAGLPSGFNDVDAMWQAGAATVMTSAIAGTGETKLWKVLLSNNIRENFDAVAGEDEFRLHAGPVGYDFDKNVGAYWIGGKGVTPSERFDMLMETTWALSLIPNIETSREIYLNKYGFRKSRCDNWTNYRLKKLHGYSFRSELPNYTGRQNMETAKDYLFKAWDWWRTGENHWK